MKYQLVKNTAWKEVEVNGELVEIPEDWDVQSFQEITQKVKQCNPSQMEVINYIDIGSIDNNLKKIINTKKIKGSLASPRAKQLIQENDVLVSMTRPSLNAVAFVTPEYHSCVCTTGVHVLRSTEQVNPKLIFFTVQSDDFVKKMSNQVKGALYPAINSSSINTFKVKVGSIEEQKKIISVLEEQETLIASYDTLIAQHQKRLDYLNDELLSGRIRLQGGDKGEPYTMVKNTKWKEVEVNGEMVEIPEDWEVTTLPMVCKFINGSSFKPNEWSKQGTPIIRIQNLSNPKADLNYYNGNKKGLVPLKKGDILFSWSGTIDIFEYTLEAGYLNQHIFKVESLNAPRNYIKYVLRRNISNIQVNGLTMHHITLTEIRKHQVSMSNSFLEQTAIANILTQQENLITQYKTQRDLEQKRFTWLSDALLSGTYRVKELP